MHDYKEIFAKHGYSLFRKESLEAAIVEALKEGNIRYLHGIPILLENADINYSLLAALAKKAEVWEDLREILFISSKVTRDRKLAKRLRELSKLKKSKMNPKGFKEAYDNYNLAQSSRGFEPSLNYQLSFLFAKRQIEILYKVKNREKLSKTEKEYFSRVIKKKLLAIRAVSPLAAELLAKE